MVVCFKLRLRGVLLILLEHATCRKCVPYKDRLVVVRRDNWEVGDQKEGLVTTGYEQEQCQSLNANIIGSTIKIKANHHRKSLLTLNKDHIFI